MTATFGKLNAQTLELQEGLNILQAPNETGKSTWCAFMTAMFYGINSRERDKAGFIAEKNRYAPWFGAPMSGRMECRAGGQEITLTRTTKRQTAPMNEFRAVYTGTGDDIPGLTGQSCGETLLGTSREVFERSAFIRQSGLAITQDAGLERRIAALITSGEEDTSYTEVSAALKKQLNRRRHNKTGQLPALEAELQELRRQIGEGEDLERQLTAARAEIEELERREQAHLEEQALLDRWERFQKRAALQEAELAVEQATQTARHLNQRMQEERIPENDTIARLRGAIVNLTTVRKSADKARAERDTAAAALYKAESALSESAFAGQTPEQVRRMLSEPPKATANLIPAILTGIAVAAAVNAAVYVLGLPQTMGAVIGCPLGTIAAIFLAQRARKNAQTAALTKRYGTADPTEIAALADTYYIMYQAREDAQAELTAKTATAEALHESLSSNEQGILLEVRRFAPAAFDISTADELLRSCAVRRRETADAETAVREAQLRLELLRQQTPPAEEPEELVVVPALDRESIRAQLQETQLRLSSTRSARDRLAGQLSGLGDLAVLRAAESQLLRQIGELEEEYASIQLAMSALESANTTLQNRFSPALGHRAAEIFSALTGGRYSGVVLDRSFHLSAEPTGDTVYRDAGLLSAGAVDQLYLAARLAICDLVLPKEQAVPLVLDDALANFDDDRCAATLRWLKEEARHRQILLFTCHRREAEFFAGDKEVSVRQLTNPVSLV